MIKMTVLNLRNILKYFLKIMLVIIILFFFSRYFTKKSDGITKIDSLINEDKLISCLDSNIPVIKEVNGNKDDYQEVEKLDLSKIVIGAELNIIQSIKLKEEKIEKKEKQEQIEQAKTGLNTQIIENNVPTRFTNSYNGVQVRNETSYNLTEEMLKPDITVNNQNVLIFHTHTCESYTPSEKYGYAQTGTYRTTDLNYNVVRVGTELENQLKSYKYNIIHDKTYHDYPAYTGSYGRSLTTVKNLLQQNTNTDVVIDLHRDAIGDYSYAPTVKIGEEYAAQLMFVIGTDGGGLEHPNWNQNLKLTVKFQEKANELYPGLFKPIILRNTRYNQHLAKGASIIEVGATGNTMDQCLVSMKYLAKVMSEVLK